MKRAAHRLILLALGGSLTTACSTAGSAVDGRPGDTADVEDAAACSLRILERPVTNARDLGGHPLSGGKTTACGLLFRGGDLSRLDPVGCSELTALGIRTVIDLRQAEVQQREPPPSCVTAQATRIPAPMPKLLPDTPENYLALLEEKAAVAQVFSVLGDAAAYPVYLHCVIGRDRASFISALVLLALGAARETVLEEFALSTAAGVPVRAPCMEAVLDEIERRGGIEDYLASLGVAAAQLGALRERMRP